MDVSNVSPEDLASAPGVARGPDVHVRTVPLRRVMDRRLLRQGIAQRLSRWPVVSALLLVCMALVAGCSLGPTTTPPASATSTGGVGGAAPTASTTAVAPPASVGDLQQAVISVINAVTPAVVEVTSSNGQTQAIGAGEILTSDGYIVTNDHVVHGFSAFSVTRADGSSATAKLIGEAADDDLAVLKINVSGAPTVTFADSSAVQVGQFVVAIGSPLGLEETATLGIVSALNRTASEGTGGPATIPLVGLIQTSAPINPGNSGGALVDLQARVIGIPTLGAQSPQGGAADGIGFAIPSNRVTFVTQQLIQNGHLTHSGRAFLGISGQDVTPALAAAKGLSVTSGVYVGGFATDASGHSPAQDGGVKVGDVIAGVNGRAVPDNDTLFAALASLPPGTSVTLAVVRGTQQLSIKVTLGERPLSS